MSKEIVLTLTMPEDLSDWRKRFDYSYTLSVDGQFKAGGVITKKDLIERIEQYGCDLK